SVWELILDAEPEPKLEAESVEEIAVAFADFTDLKSIYTLGHSTAVAALVDSAARAMGLDQSTRERLRLAALLHDIGSVAVPTGIWEQPGSLSAVAWERIRMHPYFTERILSMTPLLSSLASIAAGHHERLDGSGYHRRVSSQQLPLATRLLAA